LLLGRTSALAVSIQSAGRIDMLRKALILWKALPAGTADPDLSTVDSRPSFRQALAGAVLRGELSPS